MHCCLTTNLWVVAERGFVLAFVEAVSVVWLQIKKIQTAIRNGGSTLVSLLNYRKSGSSFKNDFALVPLANDRGKLLYYVGIQNCPSSLSAFMRTIDLLHGNAK